MKAKQCDRCGQFYSMADMMREDIRVCRFDSEDGFSSAVDLCPDCTNDLKSFIKTPPKTDGEKAFG